MAKVTCKVCNKEFKRMSIKHLATHGMNFEDYENYEVPSSPVVEEMEDIEHDFAMNDVGEQSGVITQDKLKENILSDPDAVDKLEVPVRELLEDFDVTYDELVQVLSFYTKGERIDPRIQSDRDLKVARGKIYRLKNKKIARTKSLHEAEILMKEHGFICKEVVSTAAGKTWVLIRPEDKI